MSVGFHPYLGHVSQSKSFNNGEKQYRVDGLGCRWNPYLEYDENELPTSPVSLLVGGSAVFGVGASADKFTVAAQMTLFDNKSIYPIGERALGSWQEIHGFLARFTYLRPLEIILMTGYNDAFWASRYLHAPKSIGNERHLLGVVNSPFLSQSYLGFASMGTSRLRRILAILFSGLSRIDLLREAILTQHPLRVWPTLLIENRRVTESEEEVLEELLESQIATIAVWSSLSKSLGCNLRYYLQPSQTWMCSLVGDESKHFKGSLSQRKFFTQCYSGYLRVIEQCAAEYNFSFRDLNRDLLAIPNWRSLFVDDAHLNDDGQATIAKLMSSQVI